MTSDLSNVIVVDSSVWIVYFSGRDSAQTDLLDALLVDGHVGITDVILLEVLQGFRHNKEHDEALNLLSSLTCFEIMDKQKALRYVDYYRQLRKKGITIRKSNDVMIAGYCIDHKFPLLFRDKDFLPFVQHLGLVSATD